VHTTTTLLELGAVILGLAILSRLAGRIGIPAIPLYLLAGLAFGKGGIPAAGDNPRLHPHRERDRAGAAAVHAGARVLRG
jgi:Kef-type K+ transport system membrane component KefB